MTRRRSATPAETAEMHDEVGVRHRGDDPRQGRLAAAGRPPEDDRGQLAGLDQAPQDLARPDEVLLADVLVQRPRPHAGGEGRAGAGVVQPQVVVAEERGLAGGLRAAAIGGHGSFYRCRGRADI